MHIIMKTRRIHLVSHGR